MLRDSRRFRECRKSKKFLERIGRIGLENTSVLDSEVILRTDHILRRSCGNFMIEPPTTIPTPRPLDKEYLRHSMSEKSRSSTIEV